MDAQKREEYLQLLDEMRPTISEKDKAYLGNMVDCPTKMKLELVKDLMREHHKRVKKDLARLRGLGNDDAEKHLESQSAMLGELQVEGGFSYWCLSQIEKFIRREILKEEDEDGEDDNDVVEVPVPPKPPAPLVELDDDDEEGEVTEDEEETTDDESEDSENEGVPRRAASPDSSLSQQQQPVASTSRAVGCTDWNSRTRELLKISEEEREAFRDLDRARERLRALEERRRKILTPIREEDDDEEDDE